MVKQLNATVAKKKLCQSCNKEKIFSKDFYVSTNAFDSDGRLSICKECLKKDIKYDDIQTVKDVLLQINKPFIYTLWNSSSEEAQIKGSSDIFGMYIKNIQMKDYKDLTWKDSDESNNVSPPLSTPDNSVTAPDVSVVSYSGQDNQNREDVLRMVGYDPFESESETDKKALYNRLVDFLDEGTLEDSFKLPVVIAIVKTFSQIDKIDMAISKLASNIESLTQNTGSIKSLMDAKKGLLSAITSLAKDNGLSVNHNNNRSKGGNTLNGIVKQLNEIGLEDATVNLFDLETCDAMKQIADISHRSILDQLILDENDYAEMLSEQKQMIIKLEEKASKFEEENRRLKIQLKEFIK